MRQRAKSVKADRKRARRTPKQLDPAEHWKAEQAIHEAERIRLEGRPITNQKARVNRVGKKFGQFLDDVLQGLKQRSQYWIVDGSAPIRVNGSPLSFPTQKKAKQFIKTQGRESQWLVKEVQATLPEARGRKTADDLAIRRAATHLALLPPSKHPKRYLEQETFVTKIASRAAEREASNELVTLLTGPLVKRKKIVRRFMQKVQRLLRKRQRDSVS